MLTIEQNDRLTRIGPGTPMGEVMRRYWHPIATVAMMNDRSTKKVRLLGEDMVLYKDRSGTFGLIEPHCAHRRMNMIYGIPEENGLRCPYHGWLYDETGQCIEQPYEETEDPDARFKDKIKMQAYPIRELGGMLMAYMGPLPAPELPLWDLYYMDSPRDIGYAVVPSNWLQIMENSLDPVHLEWLHMYWRNYIVGEMGEPERARPVQKHELIGFDAFEHGIIKRRVVEGGSKEDEEWAIGHPVLFPNYLKSGSTSNPVFQIRVPIDDENTGYWWYRLYTEESGVPQTHQEPNEIPFYFTPIPELTDDGVPSWDVLDNNSGQDIVAWITQGAIADRERENLGRSDRGVILYRQQLEEAMRTVEDGGDPMNVTRTPSGPIAIALEKNKLGTAGGNIVERAGGDRSGNTAKYSPILKQLDLTNSKS
jgi:5,5'-dehydrodivanillate O-demethylase